MLFKIGKTSMETFQLIKLDFEGSTLSHFLTIDCFQSFKKGQI